MSEVDLDTPALLLDIAVLDRNIARMAAFARQAGVSLRPHSKTHKCPHIAARQIAAGAIGVTCQKLGEAEVMAAAGIGGLLIANQIVGPTKIARLVALARRSGVIVAVDDPHNVASLSEAASAAGVTLGVLVEVDIGMQRCGVQPGEPALALARRVLGSPGLRFDGLMGYEGHTVMITDPDERRLKATAALRQLVATADLLRQAGVPVGIVSSSGTGTFDVGGQFPGVTEIQVGSYATMDGRYQSVGVPFEPAIAVLATVISTPRPGVTILDAGVKSISTDFGLPTGVSRLSEEHGWLVEGAEPQLRPGDKVKLLPMHGCTTINLHDRFYVVRDGQLQDVWPISARGRAQ